MAKQDILKEVKNWTTSELSSLVDRLNNLIARREQKDRLAGELEAMAKAHGFTMDALGYVREGVPVSLISKKSRTLTAANQTYVLQGDSVKLAAPRLMKSLRESGKLFKFKDLNKSQQKQAELLIADINAKKGV
jgi:hypothetical protein